VLVASKHERQKRKTALCLNTVAGNSDCEAETEAQAEARRRAGEELRWKPLVDVWNVLRGWRKGGTDQ
jgi:hypothetical protein